jgi:hypothetical protein
VASARAMGTFGRGLNWAVAKCVVSNFVALSVRAPALNPIASREGEREDLVDSHRRWKRPCLQTAHMAI